MLSQLEHPEVGFVSLTEAVDLTTPAIFAEFGDSLLPRFGTTPRWRQQIRDRAPVGRTSARGIVTSKRM